jgi:hypothetical protein
MRQAIPQSIRCENLPRDCFDERVKVRRMNRVLLGTICGILWGAADVAMTVLGNHPERTTTMLLQAFFSRFAIGFLGANTNLPIHPAISGALIGLLISLPDAFALKAYAGILGTGIIFGALTGVAVKLRAG